MSECELKVGDVVMVYEDPVSEKKPEGKAKLLELLMDGELQYWRVLFLSEDKRNPYQFNRWIKKKLSHLKLHYKMEAKP